MSDNYYPYNPQFIQPVNYNTQNSQVKKKNNTTMYIIIFIFVLVIIIIIVIVIAGSGNSTVSGNTDDSGVITDKSTNTTYYPGLQWVCYPVYHYDNFDNLKVLMTSSNYNEWAAKSGVGLLNPNIFSGNSYNFSGLQGCTTPTNSSGLYAFARASGQRFYSIVWYGYFKPNLTGNWIFMDTSDDGSYIWANTNTIVAINNIDDFDPTNLASTGIVIGVNGNAYIKNGGAHSEQFKQSANMSFTANKYYPIIILYGQNDKGNTFDFQVKDPKGNLYHDNFSKLLYNKISN